MLVKLRRHPFAANTFLLPARRQLPTALHFLRESRRQTLVLAFTFGFPIPVVLVLVLATPHVAADDLAFGGRKNRHDNRTAWRLRMRWPSCVRRPPRVRRRRGMTNDRRRGLHDNDWRRRMA